MLSYRRVKIAGESKKENKLFLNLDEARLWRSNQQVSEETEYHLNATPKPLTQIPKPDSEPAGPVFENVVEMWKKAKWKMYQESTRLVYQRTLGSLDFFCGMEVRSITSKVVDEWLDKLTSQKPSKKKQNSTRLNFLHELELLSGILRYYNEFRDDSNFVFPIKRRHRDLAVLKHVRGRKRKPMTPEQFELWAKALRQQKQGLLIETLARTQRSCALRISEAAAIRWDDIDWDKRQITIHQSVFWPRKLGHKTVIKEGFKNGDEKVLPITPDAYGLLQVLFKERSCELVFHENKKPLEYRFIQYAYDSAARTANIDFSGTHVMRRTGASWVLNATGDIDLAKQLLGNSTWSSVKPYAQRESSALTAFNDKLWNQKNGTDPEPNPHKKLRIVS